MNWGVVCEGTTETPEMATTLNQSRPAAPLINTSAGAMASSSAVDVQRPSSCQRPGRRSWARDASALARTGLTLALAGWASSAAAVGTAEGTQIAVDADLSYTVGSSSFRTQPDPLALTVARVVDLSVVSLGSAQIAPSDPHVDLEFAVTNTGNGSDAFALRAEHSLPAEQVVKVEFFERLTTDTDGGGATSALQPVDGNTVELAADAQTTVVVRLTFAQDRSSDAETDVSVRLWASSSFINETATPSEDESGSASGKTQQRKAVLRDGAGTDGDREGDGRYSADARATSAADPVEVDARLHHVTDQKEHCGDFDRLAEPGPFVPGACVAYVYRLTNTSADRVTNIAFATELDPHLVFKGLSVEGLDQPALAPPPAGADCGSQSCKVSVTDGALEGGGRAVLRVHALIK